jgi:hypothetical protein
MKFSIFIVTVLAAVAGTAGSRGGAILNERMLSCADEVIE